MNFEHKEYLQTIFLRYSDLKLTVNLRLHPIINGLVNHNLKTEEEKLLVKWFDFVIDAASIEHGYEAIGKLVKELKLYEEMFERQGIKVTSVSYLG